MAQPKTKIAYLRMVNFLSQKEVAEKIGLSTQFYNKIENGKARLTVEIAKKLKPVFKLKYIDELIDDVV